MSENNWLVRAQADRDTQMRWAVEEHVSEILSEHLFNDLWIDRGIKRMLRHKFPGITEAEIERCVEAVLGDEDGNEPDLDISVSIMLPPTRDRADEGCD